LGAWAIAGAPIPGRSSAATQADEAKPDMYVFQTALAPGWVDWSWAKHNLADKQVLFKDKPSIRMSPDNFQGVYLHYDGIDTTGYTSLCFWVHGGVNGGQKVSVGVAYPDKKFGPGALIGPLTADERISADKWAYVVVPLTKMKADNRKISGIVFQEAAGVKQGDVYFADVRFAGKPAGPPKPFDIVIDATQPGEAISPYIYGVASGTAETIRELKIGSNRNGGNPSTRYNWELGNAWSAARDWEFRNGNYGLNRPEFKRPSGVADTGIMTNRAAGVPTVLTIPTIGWVAKDDNNNTRSINVPSKIDPPGIPVRAGSDAVNGYDPTENRLRTCIQSFARKRAPFEFPPNLTDGKVYQDEWVHHLVQKFGKASEGGVMFYAMDNEADIWDSTHTDIHPVAMSYDDLLSNFLEYATAVKEVDPTANVTGPVSWGWTGYTHSPRDRFDFNARPDRKAHGDKPFIPWFLEQVRKHDERVGKRSLDVLDIHYYPQANEVYSGKSTPPLDALRIRSTRSLWDPTYKDESWISEAVQLIPRMKQWINQNYPGTKLGLTEWNWGAEKSMAGGIAAAEVLGVLGREGVYLANYWQLPPKGSPAYLAFQLFRNADGNGAGFGDKLAAATSSRPNDLSCFASVDSKTGRPIAIIINKSLVDSADTTLTVKSKNPVSLAKTFSLGANKMASIVPGADVKLSQGRTKIVVPALTALLLRFE
jgi:hypothetical protein